MTAVRIPQYGRPFEPEPMAFIDAAIKRILATGKFADADKSRTDITCYGNAVRALAAQFRDSSPAETDQPTGPY